MQSELPIGTVTFLFTDIEGSTRLLQELGDECVDGSPSTDLRSGMRERRQTESRSRQFSEEDESQFVTMPRVEAA